MSCPIGTLLQWLTQGLVFLGPKMVAQPVESATASLLLHPTPAAPRSPHVSHAGGEPPRQRGTDSNVLRSRREGSGPGPPPAKSTVRPRLPSRVGPAAALRSGIKFARPRPPDPILSQPKLERDPEQKYIRGKRALPLPILRTARQPARPISIHGAEEAPFAGRKQQQR